MVPRALGLFSIPGMGKLIAEIKHHLPAHAHHQNIVAHPPETEPPPLRIDDLSFVV